jgi:hypothetical protein
VRITSDGPGGRLGACILPVPARLGQAYQSWGRVIGSPGTDSVPAPYPSAVPQGIEYRNNGSALHSSQDAPAVWKPGVYYQPELASPPPVSVRSDNQMPVPAATPSAQPFVAFRTPKQLRQAQVGQPFVTPSYPWGN